MRGCLACATYSTGRAVRPPLTPIPVAEPVSVDVLQFPRSKRGKRYVIVFVDYLTKWPEVFPVPDQTAATVAQLLAEEIVSQYGVPAKSCWTGGGLSYLDYWQNWRSYYSAGIHLEIDPRGGKMSIFENEGGGVYK